MKPTLVVQAHDVFHDVQEHHVTDGGDAMYVRTHCGGYFKSSVFTLEPVPGVPTCLACVAGRITWETVVQMYRDATGRNEADFIEVSRSLLTTTAKELPR